MMMLRRLFGLALAGSHTRIAPPRVCVRCSAAASNGGDGDRVRGPRSHVDPYGEHAVTCSLSRGAVQRRHNEVAAAVRTCVDKAGWDGAMCGGPVFESHGGRPGDVWARRHPTHLAGQAIDVTIVTATVAAGEAKQRKYATEVAKSPGMGFAPFALDLNGGIGPSAWTQMSGWATAVAARDDAVWERGQALDLIVGRVAHAFVVGVARQIRGFEMGQNSAHTARQRARR